MEQTAPADCNMTARSSSGQRQYARVWRMNDEVLTGKGPAQMHHGKQTSTVGQ